jgi:hypothetical protein
VCYPETDKKLVTNTRTDTRLAANSPKIAVSAIVDYFIASSKDFGSHRSRSQNRIEPICTKTNIAVLVLILTNPARDTIRISTGTGNAVSGQLDQGRSIVRIHLSPASQRLEDINCREYCSVFHCSGSAPLLATIRKELV